MPLTFGVKYMLRFAASPTGDMHIASLRVAILNYLVSQQHQESFLIRIDDTDKARKIEGKDTEIMQILEKFALTHESVFHQSEHLHMHQTLAIRLLEEEKAFVCTCPPEELETVHYSGKCFDVDKAAHAKLKESGTPFVVRIKKPLEDIVINDLIQGELRTSADEVDSFIILYADGTPSPDFASACDDMLSGITTLICEEEQGLNTAKQIHIKQQLGYVEETTYAHLPLLLNDSGDKLSHAEDASTVKWLFQEGFVPDAIINYLILLGYPKAPKKIFTLPEAIKWFRLENLSKSAVKFDLEKLRFINREHLKRIDDKVLSSLFGFADADVGKLVKLYLQEASTINELALRIRPVFAPKVFKGEFAEEMKTLQKLIAEAPMINKYDDFVTYLMKKSELEGEHFFTPLRLLLTGAAQGPELAEIYPLIKSYLLEVAS